MARRKSAAEVGPLGVWAYDTRIALDQSVEAVIRLLPTTYNPATVRKVEGGSARPGVRMWRELGDLYARLAADRNMDIEPQPRLAPEPVEATQPADALVSALRDQTAAIKDLVEMIAVWVRADVAGLRPARDLGFDSSPDAVEDRLTWMEQSLREQRESEADQERSAPPERVG